MKSPRARPFKQMIPLREIAGGLASALLAGHWSQASLIRRTKQYLAGRATTAQRRLVEDVLSEWSADYAPSERQLRSLLLNSRHLARAASAMRRVKRHAPLVLDPPAFSPSPQFDELDIPQIATSGELAEWLGHPIRRLEWLADAHRRHGEESAPILQNYLYAFLPKRAGGHRLVEMPKPDLKTVQRHILREILDKAPAHEAAQGFVRGKSCLTGAQRHAGEEVVLTMDIADFFSTTFASRVHVVFRKLGYPWPAARLLTGLCTTMTPGSVFDRAPSVFDWQTRNQLAAPHLPQGAPSSPSLANLAALHLDARLAGLARRYEVAYTRYADDLTFSGDRRFGGAMEQFITIVEAIVKEEGWRINRSKTRVMRRSSAQIVTGIVVNDHLNVRRKEYDSLKAILFNCVKRGPAEENRKCVVDFRAHLDGRVEWVSSLNPERGAKLRSLFDQIDWSQ